MSNFNAKEGQDRWVLKTFKDKRNGFFVDVGAHNGISDSNTYVLEKDYDWDGICVEANPLVRSFQELEKNRNCTCVNVAISDKDGEVEFVARGRRSQLSGIYDENSDPQIKEQVDKGHSTIKIPSLSLLSLLEKYNAPKEIDYLSLDTEGSEWTILNSFDFSKYNIKTITVEHNYFEDGSWCSKNGYDMVNIRSLLLRNGYKYIKTVVADDWYIKE